MLCSLHLSEPDWNMYKRRFVIGILGLLTTVSLLLQSDYRNAIFSQDSAFFPPRKQMKAAILNEMGRSRPYGNSKPLVVEDVDLDPPGRGELLVKIKATGLCHSDLSVINGDRPRPMPMILGHEAAGEVEECGGGGTHPKPGEQG